MFCVKLKDCGVMHLRKSSFDLPQYLHCLLPALENYIVNFMAESIQMPKSLVSSTDDRYSLFPTEYRWLI